ncbi:Fc.00g057470.m01.CDS01 [Cosmosporella sp. VM-42]
MNRQRDVRLESFTDDSDDEVSSDPDLPLAGSAPQPKWLAPRGRRWEWLSSPWIRLFTERLKELLRPRMTWKYIFCAVFSIYWFLCLMRSQPLFASNLPSYSGPHAVGTVDLEIPLEKPIHISDTLIKSTKTPAFDVDTVLFSLYYPTSKSSRSRNPKHLWIPRPLSVTAEGYARIAHVDNFIVRPIFTFALWLLVGGIEIPAKVDVPLLDDETGKFPVTVFSHGMASSRTDYTHYLGELASRGHVVAAIEHRDGSCPGSLVKIPSKPDRKVLLLRENDLLSDPPMTTPKIKEEQLAFRDAEIFETVRILQEINAGKGEDIFTSSSRPEGHTLATWTNRLDFTHLTTAGHSYGATGALQALKSAPGKTNPSTGGIILDPGKESGPLNAEISVPILIVHSNSWSRTHSIFFGRPHFDTVRDLVMTTLNRTGASWFLTSLGTSHPSVTDAPLIEPLLLSWTTGATVDVREGLQEYVKVTMDFFEYLQGGKMEGVLGEEVTHEEYGVWVSDERKAAFPKDVAKFWEVHVSPVSWKT